MQELEQLINIYHTAFIVCLVLMFVFLAITVVLFFKFDIRKIIDSKTGYGAKRTIQEMEEINSRTGKLRQEMVASTPSTLKPEERIVYPVTARNLQTEQQTQPHANTGAEETVLLSQEIETTVLSQTMNEEIRQRKRELPGAFKIEKEIMLVYTNEII